MILRLLLRGCHVAAQSLRDRLLNRMATFAVESFEVQFYIASLRVDCYDCNFACHVALRLRLERRGHLHVLDLNLAVDHLFAEILEPVLREFFLDSLVRVRSLQAGEPLRVVLAAVVLRDDSVVALRHGVQLEAEVIGCTTDMLTADDDVRLVTSLVEVGGWTTVPIEKLLCLVVDFDVFPFVSHIDESVDEDFTVATLRGCFPVFRRIVTLSFVSPKFSSIEGYIALHVLKFSRFP